MGEFGVVVLLQHGAEPTIRNTDGRTALDLAEASTKAVLTGEWEEHVPHKHFRSTKLHD